MDRCTGWCQVPARASALPKVHFICSLSVVGRNQAPLLQALITYNWICSKVSPNSVILSHALVMALAFNNQLNKGHKQERTILLGPAWAWPRRTVAINNLLVWQPSHEHKLAWNEECTVHVCVYPTYILFRKKNNFVFKCLTFLNAVLILTIKIIWISQKSWKGIGVLKALV